MKKTLVTPVPATTGRDVERDPYDFTGLSAPCADGRCAGCQHPTCSCDHHRRRAPRQ
ncbi:hypothetical protein [Nonomuraea bangladeshensis]|uniref:hypothetical protein n=1 Tax=Nonomuraea bangladeshensis TaxID=404385 RepID=UPI003C30C867